MASECDPKQGALVVNINARVRSEYGLEYSETYPRGLVLSVDTKNKRCDVMWPPGFVNTQEFYDLDVLRQGFEA